MMPFSRALAMLAIAGAAFFPCAHADELQDISKMLKTGQRAQALERVNQYLAAKPKDAQGRFLKGLILTEQNKVSEAIDVFAKLSQDYPELPEPYNNIAVLYAAQGQYERARQALEMSIRTHPAYATAYENLGDVYAKLASQAYDKALQFDSSNTAAQTKLSLMRELISAGGSRTPPPAQPARVAEAARAPAVVAQAAPKPVPSAKPPEPAPERKDSVAKPAVKPAEEAKQDAGEEALKLVRAWAHAWASKDVGTYLGYYAKDFKTPNSEPRDAWEKSRKQRISAPKRIEVSVESPKIKLTGADTASVTFRQNYRSDALKASSMKTLALVRSNGKWLIQQERIGN
jgi:tetratricopeptide (TPR) repeat protein